ncbi:hypothetical protein HY004_03185 [Candidatus Saccharibacteria bacterium]|nr:hypothetical protein [Candidatus Saccharibacteria bacterium]
MNKLKTSVIAGVLTTVGTVGLVGVSAHAATTTSTDPQSDLISKIAKKFNLKSDEVKQVFDDAHKEREAERSAKLSENLQKKVDDGTITADQKTKLEAKFKELKTKHEAEREANKSSKPDRAAMKQKMESERAELKAWATQNGIDLDRVMPAPAMGMGMHRGPDDNQ